MSMERGRHIAENLSALRMAGYLVNEQPMALAMYSKVGRSSLLNRMTHPLPQKLALLIKIHEHPTSGRIIDVLEG